VRTRDRLAFHFLQSLQHPVDPRQQLPIGNGTDGLFVRMPGLTPLVIESSHLQIPSARTVSSKVQITFVTVTAHLRDPRTPWRPVTRSSHRWVEPRIATVVGDTGEALYVSYTSPDSRSYHVRNTGQ
jgi:hypothetical protein